MIWTLCLERLQDEMPANLFGMWIRPRLANFSAAPRRITPPPLPSSALEQPKSSLNEGSTFANFVQGKANQMAYAACQHVVAKPADAGHNPLFLYGATGLGKTHLMQAVGHALLAAKPNARVLYLTSEKFVGGFVSALQRGAIEDFKKSCRTLDLLLIDDIHFLAGKVFLGA